MGSASTPPRDVILDPSRRPGPSSANALLWQTKLRFVAALVAGAAAVLTLPTGLPRGSPVLVLASVGGYLALVSTLYVTARRAPDAPRAAVAVMLLGDLLFVFAATVLYSRPAYYDRSLVVAFIVLHAAQLSFSRVYSYFVAGVTAVGYLTLVGVSMQRGAAPAWGEELSSAAAFVVVALLFIHQSDVLRLRARRLVAAFERAGEGDFSREYDVAGDRHPDVITTLGRAFNRLLAQLQSMVLTDPLTGCLNRRGFDQALAREIARSSRAGSELALLAIDLDHFKHLNDRCGHLAGDAILRDLGALLRQSARAGDVVARTGGEEFTLILPDTDAPGAAQLATRLCEHIRSRAFVVESKSIRITISVGVAAATGDAVDRQGNELKLRADQALYAAKRLGRDRVLTWSE